MARLWGRGMSIFSTIWKALSGDVEAMVELHKILTIVWLVSSVPIVIFLSDSIPFLVFVSVYAVVASHWGNYQAARTEKKQDEQA